MRAWIVAVVLVVVPIDANAWDSGLEPGSRIEATGAGGSLARVWAVDDGSIVSWLEQPLASGGGQWINHGHGGSPARLHGLAATNYVSGASNVEHVFYIGQDSALYVGTSVDRGPLTWAAFAPPPSTFFVGHIAATSYLVGGVRQLVVAVPASTGGLWRWERPAAGGAATWTINTSLPWIGQYSMSVTKNPAETIVSFFTDQNNFGTRRLGMLRLNNGVSSTHNMGQPGVPCASTAAIQGWFNSTATYRLSVACVNPSSGWLYLASTTSETSTAFVWTSHAMTTIPVGSGAVTGALRASGLNQIHEMFVLLANSSVMKFTIGSTSVTGADIGVMRDVDSAPGAITIRPRGGSPRLFYVAKTSDTYRLFERRGLASNNPGDYRFMGTPTIEQFWLTPQYVAEFKLASYRGTQALSMVNRPGGGLTDWPSVHLAFSTNQNETLDPSKTRQVTKTVNIPGVGDVLHNYVTDGTTVVTDDKVAFSFQLGVARADCVDGNMVGCGCQASTNITRGTIYAVSTTDGINHSAPYLIASVAPQTVSSNTPIDHPWADIEHRPFASDIIHLAWWDFEHDHMKYAQFDQNTGLQTVYTIRTSGGAPPRIMATDSGRVVVYIGVPGGPVSMCEINPARDGCTIAPGQDALHPGWSDVGSFYYFHNIPIGTNAAIRSWYPVSMAISEADPNTINYCFEVQESAPTQNNSDIRCGRIARAIDGSWSVASAVIVNAVPNDGKDQFLPEVFVTSEDDLFAAQDTVFATWSDRSNDLNGRSYQIARTVSLDGGATFASPRLHSYVNDGENLPRHCHSASIRFAGDFSAVEGDLLHKEWPALFVQSGVIGTWVFTFMMGLGSWGG